LDRHDCVILGAGITGLSTAYHLKGDCAVYEKDDRAGGSCRTERAGEFLFDYAEHFIRADDAYVRETIEALLGSNLHSQPLNSAIFLAGTYVEYPFQLHLHGLPDEILKECLAGYEEAQGSEKNPTNFEEWILQNLGKGIAKHFMIPYNEKIWCVHPSEMSIDWFFSDSVVPKGSLEKVREGALQRTEGEKKQRWYPLDGGIESLSRATASGAKNLNLGKEAVRIILSKKTVEFDDDTSVEYKKLVNTIPLPEFVGMLDDAPGEVKKAASNLRHNSVLCVNLGVDKDKISDRHWIYFPEKKFIFSRLYFPMNFSPSMGPDGKSSVSAIITYSGERVSDEEAIAKTMDGLIGAGILDGTEDIPTKHVMNIDHGFNIPTSDTRKNVAIIRNFLASHDIHSIGRYGEWKYSGIEHSILDGKETAILLESR